MAPSNGSTGTLSNKTTNRKPVRRALNGRVKREQCTPPHSEPPMGTGRRFATAPAPATTPERPSGATPSCRLGVGERRRGPLTTMKAARKPVTARAGLTRAVRRCRPTEDGAQFHLSVLVRLFTGQVSSPKYNRPTKAPYTTPCQSPNKSQNLEYFPVQPAMILVHELPIASAW